MSERYEKTAANARVMQGRAHELVVRAERLDIPGRMVTQVFVTWLTCHDPKKAAELLTLMEMWLDDRATFTDEVINQIKATPIKRRRRK